MVHKEHDPWEEIEPHPIAGNLRARRVDAAHPFDFFWGLDSRNQKLLVFRSDQMLDSGISLPSIQGISLELDSEQITMRLLDPNEKEIFTTLCWNLIERTRTAQSAMMAQEVLVAHLFRWQRFLRKCPRGILSQEEIRGLFCELCFLEYYMINRFGAQAVDSWHGPAGHPQDFAVGTALFEIKSHLAGSAPVLMISSANQLWHESGELFLVAYTIGESPKFLQGTMSLLTKVDRVRQLVSTSQYLDSFEDKLLELGYTDLPEYDRVHFTVSQPDFFLIEHNFPRITPEAIPAGISRVHYAIDMAACLPFRNEPKWDHLGASNGN